MERFVIPGESLGTISNFTPREGLQSVNSIIYVTKCGYVNENDFGETIIASFRVAEVSKPDTHWYYEKIKVGSLVMCKVKNLVEKHCKVDIICIHGKPLVAPYRGVIYLEHIKSSFNKEFTKAYDSFNLGDIVLARVIGVIDGQNYREKVLYLLSTSEKELGVVLAKSPADDESFLIPVSWKEMICPVTHKRYQRKVAKVRIHND